MSIAIYSRNLQKDLVFNRFNNLVINGLNQCLPEAGLLVFSTAPTADLPFPHPNLRVVQPAKKQSGWLGRALEKKWTLPNLLKKNQVQALLLADVKDLLKINIPQFLLVPDDAAYIKNGHPALRKLAGLVVSSPVLKEALVKQAGVHAGKVWVVEGLVAPGLKPAEVHAQFDFKDRVTEGREFFICADVHWSREQLLTLLKAFSRFKKMQQSGWKLLITQGGNHPRSACSAVFAALDTYKYREDVVLFESTGAEDYAAAMGAAYAAVTFQQNGGFPAAAFEALQCQVPVMAPAAQKERIHPSALLFADEAALAQQLMELYKNEGLRQQLVLQLANDPLKPAPEGALTLLKQRLLQA
ncbi:glycosyltransferase [Niabella pedocola]|uniref:Glycosyltransferase n=1 Tax=Niabella pedocola TaxID=1752077 RepID=A0ABS8PV44_9BACT|nr:glycosyltransferase [Niabella pedocola]MCD2424947.1 glycosyltransferase [Niabella pedocola]